MLLLLLLSLVVADATVVMVAFVAVAAHAFTHTRRDRWSAGLNAWEALLEARRPGPCSSRASPLCPPT